ncbi:MAG: YdeI/OmpD-associated family protein [Chloroflexi bacterium]|nr:YdeI/OmpD-associated family protein [Chloroflexota bacterium]
MRSAQAWANWLKAHHATSAGVWLAIAKKDSGRRSVTYAEALDEALCYGWIDSQKKSHSETHFLQKFTLRGPRSIWSKVNREKVAVLARAGRMQPAGLQAVERAKQNGQWEAAYDAQSRAAIPADLRAELECRPKAAAFFATLDSRNRYAILHRLQIAKQAETRARRLAEFVSMLERREKIYP